MLEVVAQSQFVAVAQSEAENKEVHPVAKRVQSCSADENVL